MDACGRCTIKYTKNTQHFLKVPDGMRAAKYTEKMRDVHTQVNVVETQLENSPQKPCQIAARLTTVTVDEGLSPSPSEADLMFQRHLG